MLTAGAAQRLDLWSGRLGGALGLAAAKKRGGFERVEAGLRPELLRGLIARRGERLAEMGRGLEVARARRDERRADRLEALAARLAPALRRMLVDATRRSGEGRVALDRLGTRLDAAFDGRQRRLADRLEALDRVRVTLGYAETLERGFAIVRGDGHVVSSKGAAEAAGALEIEFRDGRLAVGGRAQKKPGGKVPPGRDRCSSGTGAAGMGAWRCRRSPPTPPGRGRRR